MNKQQYFKCSLFVYKHCFYGYANICSLHACGVTNMTTTANLWKDFIRQLTHTTISTTYLQLRGHCTSKGRWKTPTKRQELQSNTLSERIVISLLVWKHALHRWSSLMQATPHGFQTSRRDFQQRGSLIPARIIHINITRIATRSSHKLWQI